MDYLLGLLAVALLCGRAGASAADCKSYDERPKGAAKGPSADRKVVCSNMELRRVLDPDSFPNRTVTLILNNNKIQELRNGSFYGLSTLEKLDLRSNIISRVEPGAFLGLPALKKLDLSNNSVGCLNVDIFKGLTSLIRLNLSGNMFSSLAQGTFDSLASLKSLEFQTPYLLCDCNLLWLLRWVRERDVAVKNTKCAYPQALQGQLVTAVRPELLTCDAPLELPSFQLTPSQRQVVFQGDSLPFQCQASFVAEDMQVLWYQDGRMVEPDAAQGIAIEKRMVQNCSLIASALTISNIQPGFTGNWECRIWTSRGNTTRTVHIVVLESSAKYCAPERASNNKGEFRWPRTLAGIRAYHPCNRLPSSAGAYSGGVAEEQRAWRLCGPEGLWAEEDYSRCQFQKDVTRFLYVINQMPLNESSVVPRARRLLVYTIDAANFSDKMDIIFVAEMIEKFAKFVDKFKDLGEVMVSMASNLMLADDRVLWMAQREAAACSRIVACLQRIAAQRLGAAQAFSLTSPNIALEAHAVRPGEWRGMTCMLFQRPSPERNPGQDRQLAFKCNATGSFSSVLHKSTTVEASLQLPQSLLAQAGGPAAAPEDTAVFKLHLLAFRNGKFFPSAGNSSQLADGGKRRSVATPVIMAMIDGIPPHPLRTPVNVTLRRFARGSDPVAATWNASLAGGHGGWQGEGCRVLGHHDNFTTVSCGSLGNYGLLMDLTSVEYFSPLIQPLHPVIYATTIILLLCLLTIIISYLYHHRSVRVSRKFWHMLVNLCLHAALTCGVFVGGINQTRHASVCQAVGILLHYSTLATALWVGVTARNIYKQVTRKAKRYEELDEPPPPPRPMLRFYLIGGGIPIIVCGITAAANIKNYGSRTNAPYCWMGWEPSIGAFYGPAGFIVFVDCMYFLSILLQLRCHPERRYELKEPADEEEYEDDEEERRRLDPADGCRPLALQLRGAASPLAAAGPRALPLSALENEHAFSAQLMGAAGALGLYAALWVFGAMAVSQEHPYDLAFTCLYGVAALALGAFMLAHHCVNRQDMRRHWSRACCSGRRAYSAQEDALLSRPDAAASPAASKADGESARCGHSSADSSYTNKSAPSVRNSAHGSKLTNLHAEAAQCKSAAVATAPANGAAALDNSLTEHSVDIEIKMHVAPVAEVQFRPANNNSNPSATVAPLPNGHPPRHHKNRAHRAHRASRLTVLREYAYDVPTSVEGSVQSSSHRRSSNGHHHHHYDVAARNSRRAAYMAYRERHQSQMQQDSSDSASLPRRPRHSDKGEGPGDAALANGTVSTGAEHVARATGPGEDAEAPEGPAKSYGLNLILPNGGAPKDTCPAAPLLNKETAAGVKTGLWKHETTV